MTIRGWLLNAEVLEEFFNRCEKQEAITRPEREKIMDELVAELRAIHLNETDLKRTLKNKKALVIRRKPC